MEHLGINNILQNKNCHQHVILLRSRKLRIHFFKLQLWGAIVSHANSSERIGYIDFAWYLIDKWHGRMTKRIICKFYNSSSPLDNLCRLHCKDVAVLSFIRGFAFTTVLSMIILIQKVGHTVDHSLFFFNLLFMCEVNNN